MAASEHHRLSHMAEDGQSSDHETVKYGLDSVLFDVWGTIILPLLSIPDIFRLCGVNSDVRHLLFNEPTFKRLCQFRYQLSPCLNMSYIQAARTLYIATRISTLYFTDPFAENYIAGDDYPFVLRQKLRMMVLLSSLSLKPPARSGNTAGWACMRHAQDHHETARHACNLVPRLTPEKIQEHCPPSAYQDADGQVLYKLEDVSNLLFVTCGSVDEFQTTIIDYIEKDITELTSYLPYLNRSSRLVDLGKGYFNALKSNSTWISLFQVSTHAALRQDWTYNPFNMLCSYNPANPDAFTVIKLVEKLARNHSAIQLLIMGSLSTLQAEDYFSAFLEYKYTLRRLPPSTCPSIDAISRGLGNYLLSSSAESHSSKKWTRSELLHAIERYGNELALTHARTTRPFSFAGRELLHRVRSFVRNLVFPRAN
eukprot:scpid79574/ scgid18910/ 